jgi:putative FmdB family regulatory protein
MATYLYRCTTHGETEVVRPIGSAPPTWPCPECQADCARVFVPPMLSLAPSRVMAAIHRTERSADAPEVVTTLPTQGARRRTPMAPPNPAYQRLPRP